MFFLTTEQPTHILKYSCLISKSDLEAVVNRSDSKTLSKLKNMFRSIKISLQRAFIV